MALPQNNLHALTTTSGWVRARPPPALVGCRFTSAPSVTDVVLVLWQDAIQDLPAPHEERREEDRSEAPTPSAWTPEQRPQTPHV